MRSRIGPSMSSTDVKDEAHVGHRSTSVKTDQTMSIGASMVIDARSTPPLPMISLPRPLTLIRLVADVPNGTCPGFGWSTTFHMYVVSGFSRTA